MGHNNYGEPAWPNDIFYIFPVVIEGVVCFILGLSFGNALEIISWSNAFCTPLEIVPEWYLFVSFNLLRILCSKVMGVVSMVILVVVMFRLSILENASVYCNALRRAIMLCVELVYSIYGMWLTIGATSLISHALPFL
jgi:cytochrome b6-f complex subunit 4